MSGDDGTYSSKPASEEASLIKDIGADHDGQDIFKVALTWALT
jgi:hypothetical protein